MKSNFKTYFFIFIFSNLIFNFSILANENKKFLTLKKNEVNLRQGPSKEYPIILTYKKKYLPVIILDEVKPWKKIKDFEHNSGWIHASLLSKKKAAINIQKNSIIYKKSTLYSKPIAQLEAGRLVLVKKCKDKWCKVTSGNFSGWISKNYLWGKTK